MTDYILTAIIPLVLAVAVVWGNKRADSRETFMSKDYTTVLKGAACIIVILVHIPAAYQNAVQDAIGSFAYVGVTTFFLISAYGMSLSADKKKDYMRHFWRNRLAALLIPQLLVNAGGGALSLLTGGGWKASMIHINNYVVVLLEYCLWFYLVYLGRKRCSATVANVLLATGVAISSLVMYFLFDKTGWCYERWGLVWGLFIYLNMPLVRRGLKPTRMKVVTIGLLAVALGGAYLRYKPVFFWGEYLLKIVLGVAIIAFVFVLTARRQWGNRASTFLGAISYEVYLSHGIIMSVLAYCYPSLSSGWFVLTTVAATLLFAALIHALAAPLVHLCRHK